MAPNNDNSRSDNNNNNNNNNNNKSIIIRGADQDKKSGARCPFQLPGAAGPAGQVAPLSPPSGKDDNNINKSSGGTASAADLLSKVFRVGGKGGTRMAGEAKGKKILVGEVRLDRCLPGYVYKISVNKERLPPKKVPKWTVWLEVAVSKSITIEILSKDSSSSDEEAFVTVGTKTIEPLGFFTVSEVDFASGHVPVGWQRAPDMAVVLEMRLEADASQQGSLLGSGKLSTRCCDVRKKVTVLNRHESSAKGALLLDEESMGTFPPLTDVEIVIVKDSYNKALAWLDVVLEFIVERLYFLVPTLPDILGELAPSLQHHLHGILDLAVRSLDPTTEDVSRESYKAVHPAPNRPHQDVASYAQTLAEQGFLFTHWEVVRDLWVEALRSSPYMEAYELRNMELGTGSAAYRFFTLHVLRPMALAIKGMEDVYEDPSNAKLLEESWAPYASDPAAKWVLGVEFYARLFGRYPELVPLFRGNDMDSLSKHLGQMLEIVATSFGDMWSAMPTLRQLGVLHADLGIPSSGRAKLNEVLMEVLGEKLEGFSGEEGADGKLRRLWEQVWVRTAMQARLPMDNAERLVSKAYEWVDQASHELCWEEGYTASRKSQIFSEVINRGTYSHTPEELVHGARVCWRNSAKCIGRIAWKTLTVRDKRHVTDVNEVFAECMEHQRLATADGSIKSVMTVFPPQVPGERMGLRFWSSQLTRYAAYTMEDGTTIGDRANLDFTEEVIRNGWVPPEPRGHFDVLPIVLENSQKEISMFDVPPGYNREVLLEHPDHPEFAKLGLKWGAVPSITNFTMSLGGIEYCACPFNGWFMNTEVARDLMEEGRCGRAHDIAKSFGVKVSETDPFWKDRTFLELNFAIVHSFKKNGATIVDHHTASQQFMTHDLREKRMGRECPAQWSWIVPPLGGSLTSVFHHEMRHFDKDPRFVYQAEIFRVKRSEHAPVSAGTNDGGGNGKKRILVLYGSETGTAEGYAYETAARLRTFACHVAPLDELDPSDLTASDVHAVLVVMSTFGDGGMPQGAKGFYENAQGLPAGSLKGVRYSLMALGSTAYPDFCMAGKNMDILWRRLGAEALSKVQMGNELDGQAQSVREWQNLLDPVLGVGSATLVGEEEAPAARIKFLDDESEEVKGLLDDHMNFVRKGFSLCQVTENEELLQPATKTRSTRFVEIDLSNEPELTYETGDHASVLPSNSLKLVANILRWVGADHCQWFTVEGGGRPPFPVPTTISRAFVNELDLCPRQPIGGLLELFLRRASNDLDKRKIEALLEAQDTPDWNKVESEFLNNHTTILAVLKSFPSAEVSAEDLLVTLPVMKPRHYSISSASEVFPRRLQLTVGVLKVKHDKEGTTREGLCSHFLSRQEPGDVIRIAVKPSSFRAPSDLTASPIIMVGPGTGISPMMGFLQARAEAFSQGKVLAPCHVYFGCRDSTEFLYSDHMRQWHKDGVVTGLHVAMSREGPKTYVQHLISRQPAKVWELLSNTKCHVYVCGDSAMGEQVKAEMMMAALKCGSMDRLSVVEFFKTMKKEGRLQSDTWGVGLPGTAAVDTFLANQGTEAQNPAQAEAAGQLPLPLPRTTAAAAASSSTATTTALCTLSSTSRAAATAAAVSSSNSRAGSLKTLEKLASAVGWYVKETPASCKHPAVTWKLGSKADSPE